MRHLNDKHEGQGTPILYNEYQMGKSTNRISEKEAAARTTYPSGVSPKARQLLTLLDERTNGEVCLLIAFCAPESRTNIDVSARVCTFCMSVVIEGYIYRINGTRITLPSHNCRCEWLFDHPAVDNKRRLVETYLNEKIGQSLANILWPFGLNADRIVIKFLHLKELNRARNSYYAYEMMIRQEKSEDKKEILKVLSEKYEREEQAIADDIARNYFALDAQQFWWCSYINGAEGSISVSAIDALLFLQFFKGNAGRVKIRFSSQEYHYYKLTIS